MVTHFIVFNVIRSSLPVLIAPVVHTIWARWLAGNVISSKRVWRRFFISFFPLFHETIYEIWKIFSFFIISILPVYDLNFCPDRDILTSVIDYKDRMVAMAWTIQQPYFIQILIRKVLK